MPHEDVRYSPSGLRNLELCSQYRNDTNRDTSAADRGTRIHKAIESADFKDLNEEEMECAAKCLEYRDAVVGLSPDGKTFHELRLTYPELGLTGTADYVITLPSRKTLILADWKTGRKEVEPAEHNFQMQCYVFMLLLQERFRDYQTVEAHLVTPLTPIPASQYTYTRADLQFIGYRIERAISGIGVNPPQPYVGVCDWCGNKGKCPALRQVALLQAEALPVPSPVHLSGEVVVTPNDRAALHTLASLLEDWAKQVKRANTDAVVQEGVEVPGFVLRQRAGHLSITDTAQAVELLVKDLPAKSVLAAATLSVPKLADIYTVEKGGDKKENRKELEAILKSVLVHGDPVVFLQRGRAKSKGALTNG